MPKPKIEHCFIMVSFYVCALYDSKPKAKSFSSFIPAEHKPIPRLAPARMYLPSLSIYGIKVDEIV
jgi:hypothetical protein